MSVRLRFIGLEALRSLKTNFATTLAATVTVLIVMLLLGVFVSLGTYMYSKADSIRHQVNVRVFLQDGASNSDVHSLVVRLTGNPAVKHVSYVSPAMAMQRMRKELGSKADQYFKDLPENPFPASLEVTLKHPDEAKSIANSMIGLPGVERGSGGVNYGGQNAGKVLRVGGIIEGVVGALIVLLTIAAMLLVANTIRLSIFARRREVEVMKLVGATNWFVRLPFMLEGMVCGLVGALLSIALLYASYALLLRGWIHSFFLTGGNVHAISFTLLAALLTLAGVGLGAAGSGITMRRFLRV